MGKNFVAALILFVMGSPLVAASLDSSFAYDSYILVDSQGAPEPEDFDAQEQAPLEESRFSEHEDCSFHQAASVAPFFHASREEFVETFPDLSFPALDIQRPPESRSLSV